MKIFSTAILMVFCSLLGSAFSCKCLGCLSLNSTECDGKPIDCPENRCMTVSQLYKNGNRTCYTTYKGCANTTLCGAFGTLSQDPYVRIGINVACCEGENCNTGKFYFPKDDMKPNGFKCPSAYCEGMTDDCKKDLKMMECRGPDTCCFDFRTRIADPLGYEGDYSAKGCATPQACKCNFNCLIGVKGVRNEQLKCCDDVKP